LTETEQRIAQLVAQSLTNKEIASTLGISYRTVETHISHILSKKNLANRVELALFVAHESQGRRASS
jgi:non-specific serine/threonine protein kinase